MTKCLQESRMREICTSGSMRESGRPTLLRNVPATLYSTVKIRFGCGYAALR
jgi:hypothetical protein